MGSGGVAIAALPTVICLKVPFSDGLGGIVFSRITQWFILKVCLCCKQFALSLHKISFCGVTIL